MKCPQGGSFSNGELQRFGNIELSPSAAILNYGQVSPQTIRLDVIIKPCSINHPLRCKVFGPSYCSEYLNSHD